MKISLVNPSQHTNYPQLPLGLAYIAAVLEKGGHKVSIIDANLEKLTPQQAAKEALKKSPDIIGITSMTPEINEAITISENIKSESNVPVICGGPHPSALPEYTLKTVPTFDYLVVGEGEITTLELVETLDKGNSPNKVKGLGYRKGKKIIVTPFRPFLKNLDSLPFPAYHLFSLKKYNPHPPHGNRRPIIPLLTSRGCPFRCL
jgi:magnesium-protoporphyrin IX monomethyl ester (oxidative) cyclase